MLSFHVMDIQTGGKPDLETIIKKEDWTGKVDYRYKPSFILKESGELILRDLFGNIARCPHDRFRVEMVYPVDGGYGSYAYIY